MYEYGLYLYLYLYIYWCIFISVTFHPSSKGSSRIESFYELMNVGWFFGLSITSPVRKAVKLGGDAGKILGIRTPQWIRFWLGKIIGMTLRHWYVGKVFKGHVAGSMSRMWSIDLNKFRLDGVFLVWLCDIKVWKTWETTMVTAEWQK